MKMKNWVTQLQEKENTTKSNGMAVVISLNDVILTRSDTLFAPNPTL